MRPPRKPLREEKNTSNSRFTTAGASNDVLTTFTLRISSAAPHSDSADVTDSRSDNEQPRRHDNAKSVVPDVRKGGRAGWIPDVCDITRHCLSLRPWLFTNHPNLRTPCARQAGQTATALFLKTRKQKHTLQRKPRWASHYHLGTLLSCSASSPLNTMMTAVVSF